MKTRARGNDATPAGTVVFRLTIDCDNAAFGEGSEVCDECARLLRKVADRLDRGDVAGRIMDGNGNGVGEFALGPKPAR